MHNPKTNKNEFFFLAERVHCIPGWPDCSLAWPPFHFSLSSVIISGYCTWVSGQHVQSDGRIQESKSWGRVEIYWCRRQMLRVLPIDDSTWMEQRAKLERAVGWNESPARVGCRKVHLFQIPEENRTSPYFILPTTKINFSKKKQPRLIAFLKVYWFFWILHWRGSSNPMPRHGPPMVVGSDMVTGQESGRVA